MAVAGDTAYLIMYLAYTVILDFVRVVLSQEFPSLVPLYSCLVQSGSPEGLSYTGQLSAHGAHSIFRSVDPQLKASQSSERFITVRIRNPERLADLNRKGGMIVSNKCDVPTPIAPWAEWC